MASPRQASPRGTLLSRATCNFLIVTAILITSSLALYLYFNHGNPQQREWKGAPLPWLRKEKVPQVRHAMRVSQHARVPNQLWQTHAGTGNVTLTPKSQLLLETWTGLNPGLRVKQQNDEQADTFVQEWFSPQAGDGTHTHTHAQTHTQRRTDAHWPAKTLSCRQQAPHMRPQPRGATPTRTALSIACAGMHDARACVYVCVCVCVCTGASNVSCVPLGCDAG